MVSFFPDMPEIKKRGKHYVKPNGYAAIPGTGPEGEKCKTCKHMCRVRMAKVYHKCELRRRHWTGGRRSDILANSPACRYWEDDGS